MLMKRLWLAPLAAGWILALLPVRPAPGEEARGQAPGEEAGRQAPGEEARGEAPGEEARSEAPEAGLEPEHDESTCTGCAAEAVWLRFVEHIRARGKGDLIPEGLLPPDELKPETPEEVEEQRVARVMYQTLLLGTDPVRGVLFRLSPDFINLDEALASYPIGTPVPEDALPRIRDLAGRIAASEDPFLAPYGALVLARLALQEEALDAAIPPLEALTRSCQFFPRKDAFRLLAEAYLLKGDDALAVLTLQFLKLEAGAEDTGGQAWADEELKRLRDRKFLGPLDNSETSMRSIEALISQRDVGAGTQSREERVEEIIDRVVKLLERQAGACSSGGACPNAIIVEVPGEGQSPGQGQGRRFVRAQRPGQNRPGGQRPGQQRPGEQQKDGEARSSVASGKAAEKSLLKDGESADMELRDLTPEEKEAWGRINDRKVARSLSAVWDKVPISYRLIVTQYFKDITDPEVEEAPAAPPPAGGAGSAGPGR